MLLIYSPNDAGKGDASTPLPRWDPLAGRPHKERFWREMSGILWDVTLPGYSCRGVLVAGPWVSCLRRAWRPEVVNAD
jgi:hypothetical protein